MIHKNADVICFEPTKDPPQSIIYPAEDVELGVENSLICFVNHIFPPYIEVSWTKNGRPVSEGVLSRYYPNNDQTFHQFSTLTFTPSEGDIYSCTVEHLALEKPKTRFWGDCAILYKSDSIICSKLHPCVWNDEYFLTFLYRSWF